MKPRPLSPHLTIYKLQISSALSIFHRITGVGLFFSTLFIAWWFIILIFGDLCNCALKMFECGMVRAGLFFISIAFFYHLATGIRHLFWDIGKGFSIKIMTLTGVLALTFCFTFTLLFWLFII